MRMYVCLIMIHLKQALNIWKKKNKILKLCYFLCILERKNNNLLLWINIVIIKTVIIIIIIINNNK